MSAGRKVSNYVRPGAMGLVIPSTPGSTSTVNTVTDGTTTVSPATSIDFTSGAVVSNGGGGVAQVAIAGAVPWSYAKANGGLHGDGVTDDTAAFQAWITSVTASGTKSGWFWFEPGTYLIGGALQDTGAFNGQVLLPNVAYSGHAQISLRFQGAARPATNLLGNTGPSPSGYSIIKSTLTGASGTAACISGGNATNNITVYVEDLICIAPDNPTFTFWNLAYTQGGGIRDLLIYSANYWAASITQPSHSNSYGVKLPQATYSAYTYCDQLTVIGFYTGVLHGELADAHYLVGICIVGVELPAMPHSAKIAYIQMTGCTYGMRATGALPCDIDWYDAEHFWTPNNPAWTVTTYDLDDASNYLTGHIRWWGVKAAVGPDHVFNVNGASNAHYEEIGALPAGVPTFATPAIVLGTAAAAGAATTAIRSDSTIVAFDATVPVTQALGDGAATGSATVAARRDHKHGMPALSTATPLVESGTGSTGTGTLSSREDHVHPASSSGGAHYLVIASSHSTPLVFGDIVQDTAGDDFVYTS